MKRISIKTVVVFLALTILSCGRKEHESKDLEEKSPQIVNNRIQVTRAQFTQGNMRLGVQEKKLFPTLINANGMIDVPPENRAVVNAKMGGYIKTTPFLVGDKVSKGQILVSLENPLFVTLQQEYLEANEQLIYLKAEYDRQVVMKAENITSQKNFLKAESEYKTTVARHKGLAEQLKMLNISPSNLTSSSIKSIVHIQAPISGSITRVNVKKGSYVSPATEILEIVDNDHIHLELSVFEKDIMKLRKGQKINFKIPEASPATFNAKVFLVGTSLEENRTIKVHGHLEEESKNNFLNGMFVEAQIMIDSTMALALPSESIVEVGNKNYALTLDEKQGDSYYFTKREVEIKQTYEGYSVINSGDKFDPETQFLTKNAFVLLGE